MRNEITRAARFLAVGLWLVALSCTFHEAQGKQGKRVAKKTGGYTPFFQEGEPIEIYVYCDDISDPFSSVGPAVFASPPVHKLNTTFSWNGAIGAKTIQVTLPERVRLNQSDMYAHVFVTKDGIHPNIFSPGTRKDPDFALKLLHRTVPLVRVLPEIPIVKKRYLLTEPAPVVDEKALAEAKTRIVPYWAPRLAVFVVMDTNTYVDMTDLYVSPFLLYAMRQFDAIDTQVRVMLFCFDMHPRPQKRVSTFCLM
jgi:hypothetical protein